LATLIEAGIAHLQGHRGEAAHAAELSARQLDAVGMEGHRIVAEAYAARLGGRDASIEALRSRGIAKPDRFAALLVPGYAKL
jgi:hypothetical protein